MRILFTSLVTLLFATLTPLTAGCGKCESSTEVADPEAATAKPLAHDDKASEGKAAAEGTSKDDSALSEAERDAILAALVALEVPEMGKSRATRRDDLVSLQFDHIKANAAGNLGTIEVSAGFCQGCAPEVLDDEARQERARGELGEIHTDNPDLIVEVGEFELAPERSGPKVYRRSFVANDDVRASVHTLSVEFFLADRVVRLLAYPRTGFPETVEDFDRQYSKAELEADVKRVFEALWPVLWPPANPAGEP